MTATTPRGQTRYVFTSGARPLDGYTIRRAIGRGGFGEVYYATSDAGKEVALKLITRNLDVERRGVVQCMNLKSPHLIAIHDLRTNDEGDTFVIMEYVSGPSLAQVLEKHPKGLPLDDVRAWLVGLVEGVAYLHDHGIVHRDLKPANLFLEEGVVKIGDYGLTKAITQSRDSGHSESVGTCHYMAPEISSGKYQKPIDIYALGIIVYEMITGRVPFDGESVGEILMKHLTARPDLSPLPEPYRSIVGKALAKDPNQRPSNVQALLLPGDAPKGADIRIIGDSRPVAPPSKPAQGEEILRIGDEEPVIYIGPETRPAPPRRPPTPAPVVNGVTRLVRAARARQAAMAAPRVVRRPSPPPSVPPPATPSAVPLPSGRVRLAEGATSLLAASLGSGLTSAVVFPLYHALGIDLPTNPSQLALLFGTTLLGCWAVLIPTKVWEGTEGGFAAKRTVMLVAGLLLGVFSMALGMWSGSASGPNWAPQIESPLASWTPGMPSRGFGMDASFIAFFGLAMAALPWQKLTARDRFSRFRFLPLGVAGLFSGLIGAMMPAPPQPWGLIVIVLIAVIVQLVSPWDRSAAEYALYRKHHPAA